MYTTIERSAEAETSDIPATARGMRTNPPWLIDEYAIMRTMLVWRSATTFPTVMVSAESTHMNGCHTPDA